MKKDMIVFLNDLHDRKNDSYGISYFSQFLSEFEKYNFSEILAYLVSESKFSLTYIMELMLSVPFLWINLNYEEWIKIMSLLNPRPQAFSREIVNTGFVDIHFMCRYFRLDVIEAFLKQDNFSKEDKKKILQYSDKIAPHLFMDELDVEDLDGSCYIHKSELEKARLKLISTNKFKSFDYTVNELRIYTEEQLKKYL